MSDRIQVIARIRPLTKIEIERNDDIITSTSDNHIFLEPSAISGISYKSYKLDGVVDSSESQSKVFEYVEPLLHSVFDGYNCSLFTYGQTGTGKTYTMLGYDFWSMASDDMSQFSSTKLTTELRHSMGVIPRTMIWIFQKIATLRSASVNVSVSYIEIYNEKLVDLLNVSPEVLDGRGSSYKSLEIRETKKGEILVSGLTQIHVRQIEEVMEVLWAGARARCIAATDMNEHSSRSHTIFQVQFEMRSSHTTSKEIKKSKLCLVDLAGSEKWRGHQIAQFSQERIKEFTSINKSLSALGNCISALMQSSRGHVPYRDSKLTRLLQDSLGGNTKTLFIVTLSPSSEYTDETVSTLQFADRAMRVRIQTTINKDETGMTKKMLMDRYNDDIGKLKKVIALLVLKFSHNGEKSTIDIPEIDIEELLGSTGLFDDPQPLKRTSSSSSSMGQISRYSSPNRKKPISKTTNIGLLQEKPRSSSRSQKVKQLQSIPTGSRKTSPLIAKTFESSALDDDQSIDLNSVYSLSVHDDEMVTEINPLARHQKQHYRVSGRDLTPILPRERISRQEKYFEKQDNYQSNELLSTSQLFSDDVGLQRDTPPIQSAILPPEPTLSSSSDNLKKTDNIAQDYQYQQLNDRISYLENKVEALEKLSLDHKSKFELMCSDIMRSNEELKSTLLSTQRDFISIRKRDDDNKGKELMKSKQTVVATSEETVMAIDINDVYRRMQSLEMLMLELRDNASRANTSEIMSPYLGSPLLTGTPYKYREKNSHSNDRFREPDDYGHHRKYFNSESVPENRKQEVPYDYISPEERAETPKSTPRSLASGGVSRSRKGDVLSEILHESKYPDSHRIDFQEQNNVGSSPQDSKVFERVSPNHKKTNITNKHASSTNYNTTKDTEFQTESNPSSYPITKPIEYEKAIKLNDKNNFNSSTIENSGENNEESIQRGYAHTELPHVLESQQSKRNTLASHPIHIFSSENSKYKNTKSPKIHTANAQANLFVNSNSDIDVRSKQSQINQYSETSENLDIRHGGDIKRKIASSKHSPEKIRELSKNESKSLNSYRSSVDDFQCAENSKITTPNFIRTSPNQISPSKMSSFNRRREYLVDNPPLTPTLFIERNATSFQPKNSNVKKDDPAEQRISSGLEDMFMAASSDMPSSSTEQVLSSINIEQSDKIVFLEKFEHLSGTPLPSAYPINDETTNKDILAQTENSYYDNSLKDMYSLKSLTPSQVERTKATHSMHTKKGVPAEGSSQNHSNSLIRKYESYENSESEIIRLEKTADTTPTIENLSNAETVSLALTGKKDSGVRTSPSTPIRQAINSPLSKRHLPPPPHLLFASVMADNSLQSTANSKGVQLPPPPTYSEIKALAQASPGRRGLDRSPLRPLISTISRSSSRSGSVDPAVRKPRIIATADFSSNELDRKDSSRENLRTELSTTCSDKDSALSFKASESHATEHILLSENRSHDSDMSAAVFEVLTTASSTSTPNSRRKSMESIIMKANYSWSRTLPPLDRVAGFSNSIKQPMAMFDSISSPAHVSDPPIENRNPLHQPQERVFNYESIPEVTANQATSKINVEEHLNPSNSNFIVESVGVVNAKLNSKMTINTHYADTTAPEEHSDLNLNQVNNGIQINAPQETSLTDNMNVNAKQNFYHLNGDYTNFPANSGAIISTPDKTINSSTLPESLSQRFSDVTQRPRPPPPRPNLDSALIKQETSNKLNEPAKLSSPLASPNLNISTQTHEKSPHAVMNLKNPGYISFVDRHSPQGNNSARHIMTTPGFKLSPPRPVDPQAIAPPPRKDHAEPTDSTEKSGRPIINISEKTPNEFTVTIDSENKDERTVENSPSEDNGEKKMYSHTKEEAVDLKAADERQSVAERTEEAHRRQEARRRARSFLDLMGGRPIADLGIIQKHDEEVVTLIPLPETYISKMTSSEDKDKDKQVNIKTNDSDNKQLTKTQLKGKKSKVKPLWKSYVDANSGYSYFHNKLTGETTWDEPSKEELLLKVVDNEIITPEDPRY